MKLTKRSNGVWMLEVTIGDRRIRKSTGERDKAAARERAVTLLAGIKRAEGVQDWTLGDAMRDCYARVWASQKASHHVWQRLGKLERDYSEFWQDPLEGCDYDRLVALTALMEQRGLRPATVNRYLALISKALVEAVKRGKLAIKPPLPYRQEPKGKLRWITREEENRLLDGTRALWTECDAMDMRALIEFLVDTGCRLSEALKAPRHSLYRVTFTDTKNGGTRAVPLTERAQRALQCVPMWTAPVAISRFSRLRDHCGMPDVSLHTLRHTCASRLVQGGMDLYRVKEWLGHSSITVTQRYAHLSPTNLTQGVDILSADTSAPIG